MNGHLKRTGLDVGIGILREAAVTGSLSLCGLNTEL
jgi:hypothetical protein